MHRGQECPHHCAAINMIGAIPTLDGLKEMLFWDLSHLDQKKYLQLKINISMDIYVYSQY